MKGGVCTDFIKKDDSCHMLGFAACGCEPGERFHYLLLTLCVQSVTNRTLGVILGYLLLTCVLSSMRFIISNSHDIHMGVLGVLKVVESFTLLPVSGTKCVYYPAKLELPMIAQLIEKTPEKRMMANRPGDSFCRTRDD